MGNQWVHGRKTREDTIPAVQITDRELRRAELLVGWIGGTISVAILAGVLFGWLPISF